MRSITNQPVADTYPAEAGTASTVAMLRAHEASTTLIFTLAGNAFIQLGYGSAGQFRWTEEFPSPTQGYYTGVTAVRWRNAVAGVTAQITAIMTEGNDPKPQNAVTAITSALQVRDTVGIDPIFALLTHDRHLLVSQQWPYGYAQYARLIQHDDFNAAPIKWTAAGGAVALSAARSLDGAGSMTITSPAGAGAVGIARKFFPLPADQQASSPGVPAFPLLHTVISFWWNPNDANVRDLILTVRPDDSANRWEARVRYQWRFLGAGQFLCQYLDSANVFQTLPNANPATYPIRDGGGVVSDPWHFLMLVMSYQQTNPPSQGFFRYHFMKFDDFSSDPTWQGTPCRLLASNGVRELNIDIEAISDNAGAAMVFVDEFLYSDIAAVHHLA